MQLHAEFTAEPFRGEAEDPPAYASAPVRVLRAAGLAVEFGPLGTAVSGDSEELLDALHEAVAAAFEHGATSLTLQVRLPEAAGRPPRHEAGLDRLLTDVAAELGGPLHSLPRADKQRAVRLLEERGAFEFRKSAETVAEALGVTRFTVYNYLNRSS